MAVCMIIKKLAKTILSSWEKKQVIEPHLKSVYQYGIELIISSVISTFLILILGMVLFTLTDAVIFLITFIPIRLYCGGYHANTYFVCNISIAATFCLSSYCARVISISINSFFIISIICFSIFIFICPVESKYKPLNPHQKKRCKIISLVALLVILFTCFILYFMAIHYYAIVLFTIVAVTILMPIGLIKNHIERRI